jgi:Ca-activated chloride channel family protein
MSRRRTSSRTLLPAASAAALVVCALGAQATTPQQGSVFRSASRTVAVYTTVTEADGHLVTDLQKDDFEVYDDGKLQPLSLFANDIQPITLVGMLDLSGSMSGNIPLLRRAASQLASHLSKDDKARFGEFGDHVDIVTPEFTNDVNELIRNLYLDLDPGGATPLWNAIDVAMNALVEQQGRRVVLIFTDGYDTNSRAVTLGDDVKRAQEENFMIYAVGLRSGGGGHGGFGSRGGARGGGGGGRGDEPDPGLKTIAEESGGGYLELKAATELDAAFARVVEELHHQYILGFVPAVLDGRLHKIEVRVRKPGLTARARKSYLASPEKAIKLSK